VTEVLEHAALDRWRRHPQAFIAEILRDPETGRPFQLFDAQKEFLDRAYLINDSGRLGSFRAGLRVSEEERQNRTRRDAPVDNHACLRRQICRGLRGCE
jgi:hypothetical protein